MINTNLQLKCKNITPVGARMEILTLLIWYLATQTDSTVLNFSVYRHVKSYLEFVGDGKGFSLNVTPNAIFPFPSPFPPYDILPNLTTPKYKQLSKRLYSSLDSGNQRSSRSTENISQPSSMKTLFKQESERGKSGYGLSDKIKKLKNPHNYSLSKKMLVLKSKLADSIGEESDDSLSVPTKKKHFKRSTSDSNFMAEVLARSVIHAHNSLSCILEVRGSSNDEEETENTLDKLEPLANLLGKTVSEPLIGSDSECCFSSSESSSSCSDDDDDLNYKVSDYDLDTISNIIKDVEMLQLKQSRPRLQKQFSLPALGPNRVDSLNSLSDNVYKLEEFAGGSTVESDVDETNLNRTPTEQAANEDNNNELSGDKNNQVGNTVEDIPDVAFQGIVPEAIKGVELKSKGLIKTAIQAMLLDKVSLMGTYTPPTSPSAKSNTSKMSFNQKSTSPQSQFNFSQARPRMPKSASSVSFADYLKQKDTVLGVPFTSLYNNEYFKKRQSHPCRLDELSSTQIQNDLFRKERQNCFSDNQLNKPLVKTMLDQSLKKRKLTQKLKIFHLNRKTFSHESSLNDQSKRLGFLPRSRKSSESDKKDKSSIINRIFGYKHKGDKLSVSSNVSLPSPSQIDLTDTNNSSDNLPINTQIEQGNSCSNTKHACITSNRHYMSPQQEQNRSTCQQNAEHQKVEQSPARVSTLVHRRSSDSDLSITPKGNSLTGSDKSGGQPSGYFMRNNLLPSKIHQENFDMLEYPFLTLLKVPPDLLSQIGGVVSARSVKRLETISNIEEPESRDTWWSELRTEIRSHARSLNCNAVLGYTESASICDDVCILSACGTAVVIDFHKNDEPEDRASSFKQNFVPKEMVSASLEKDKGIMNSNKVSESPENSLHISTSNVCTITHLPYESNNVALKATVGKCMLCRKGKVPEVLIATIEPPEGLPSAGRGCFLESYICRPLKDLKGEWIAKEISDGLPFLEYELHRLLINKLKIKGMNAVFGLKFRITVGEKMIIALATGTAVFLTSLPSPAVPKLVSDESNLDLKLVMLQKQLNETIKKNKETYQIDDEQLNSRVWSDDDSEEEPSSLDLSSGNKDCCVLEVDDPEDEGVLFSLMKDRPPDGFHVVNTESIPGLEDMEIIKNLQMFTQIRRFKFSSSFNIDEQFRKLLQTVYFKLRQMVPCALCNIQFRCDIPEPDEVQLLVYGMALGLGKKQRKTKSGMHLKRNEDDLIFKLDEDNIPENSVVTINKSLKFKQRSPSKYRPQSMKQRHTPHREIHGVDITPLSYVPGATIDNYLGNLNFFFIRETTSIREEGGLSGFLHSFVTEVLAIVRAHVAALGGNALVAFFLTEITLNHNFHKNQGQCLINVGGDVVSVIYFKEDT